MCRNVSSKATAIFRDYKSWQLMLLIHFQRYPWLSYASSSVFQMFLTIVGNGENLVHSQYTLLPELAEVLQPFCDKLIFRNLMIISRSTEDLRRSEHYPSIEEDPLYQTSQLNNIYNALFQNFGCLKQPTEERKWQALMASRRAPVFRAGGNPVCSFAFVFKIRALQQ